MTRIKKTLIPAAAVFLFIILLFSATAHASSDITQKGVYKDKVVIKFTEPYLSSNETVDRYIVKIKKNNSSNYKKVKTLSGTATKATLTGLSPANSYEIALYYDSTYTHSDGSTSSYTDNYAGTLYDVYLLPAKVKGVKQVRWYHYIEQIDAGWNKQPSISGYQYEFYNGKNKRLVRKKVEERSFYSYVSFPNISNSQSYKLRVRGYTKFGGKTYWGPWSSYAYFIGQTPDIKARFRSGKLKVSWGKVPGATSYTVMVSAKQDKGYKALKTVSASKRSATVARFGKKAFKKGKTYYVYVRSNKKVGKKTFTSNSSDGLLYLTSAKR